MRMPRRKPIPWTGNQPWDARSFKCWTRCRRFEYGDGRTWQAGPQHVTYRTIGLAFNALPHFTSKKTGQSWHPTSGLAKTKNIQPPNPNPRTSPSSLSAKRISSSPIPNRSFPPLSPRLAASTPTTPAAANSPAAIPRPNTLAAEPTFLLPVLPPS